MISSSSTQIYSGYTTTVLVSSFPSTPPSMEEHSKDATLYIYIGICVAAVVLIVAAVIVISLIVYLRKRQNKLKRDIVNIADKSCIWYNKLKDRMEFRENIAYGTTTFKEKEDGYEYVSTTVNN